ncbi:odorant receptor 67d-like [Toxorhynchites rutilus septentrionalis]|uniref:odorant receptor 67d-like n=1 Tax=Toxorhynchites rutilus septentrionalis TaxID=329112 RepID=UPI002479CDFF|nr:odorant receptor 67d-like [Toxorhynchites rutilus septentrionalis]
MTRPAISAAEKFEQNYRQNLKLSGSIGLDVLDYGYRFGGRTLLTLMVAITATFMSSYAFLFGLYQADMLKVMDVIPFFMIIFQGVMEAMKRMLNPTKYRVLLEKSKRLFEHLNQNEGNSKELYDALQYTLTLQRLLVYWYSIIYVIVISITFAISFVGEKQLPMPLLLPGIDESSTTGFILLTAIDLVQMIVGNRGYITFDSHFLFMVFPISGYVNAIENEINTLNSMLNAVTRDQKAISAQFLRIFSLHQMLDEFEISFENEWAMSNLMKIGSAILGLVSCLSLVFVGGSVRTYLTLGLFFTQMTQYCLMGTIITVKNEHLVKALYTIEWYLLHHREAKHLVLMLQRAQNAPCATIGGIAPLDVETYVQIMKTIYSFVMAMITFME